MRSLPNCLRRIQRSFRFPVSIRRIRPRGIVDLFDRFVVSLLYIEMQSHLSIHHFPEDVLMDESYPLFIEKMSARAERLEHYLQTASGIVLISDRTNPREDMTEFLRTFSDLYTHLNIRLINTRHDENAPYDSYRQEPVFSDGGLSYIEYIFNDTDHGLDGNVFVWSKILSNYVISPRV